jgi:hypothetical protein
MTSTSQASTKSPSASNFNPLRDLLLYPSRCVSFPPRNHAFHHPPSNPQSPSVTSVTSVRCPPRWVTFPPRNHAFHQKPFCHPILNPLGDLRDLCAMLSPRCVSFPPRTTLSTKSPSAIQSSVPLCDLRDLCAMLSPRCVSFPPGSDAVHDVHDAVHQSNYSRSNSAISAIDRPLIIGSSLSTVDWIMARFFC